MRGPSLLTLTATLAMIGSCLGGSCSVRFGDDQVPLNEAEAEIDIRHEVGSQDASVTARIADFSADDIELGPDQTISVNGVALSGPNAGGDYTATVPAAARYTITVAEPTRGVFDTTVDAPADFQITAPAAGATASLSGFDVRWSAAEAGMRATVELRQTLLGRSRFASLGPVPDSGALFVGAADLRDFQQGAELRITVRRINDSLEVTGLGSARVSIERRASVTVTPGP